MKTSIRITLLLLAAAALGAPSTASAQSDILLRLRSGSPAGDRVRVDSAGGFVSLGTLGIGIIPVSGNPSNGVRMMWYPFRGAFRAGSPGAAGATTWDDANLGFYSWAGGSNTLASQYAAFAFGDGAQATSSYAVSFGANTQVSGNYGFGTGYQSKCAGTACTATGYVANADGIGAVALGYRVTADADYSVALGYRASVNGQKGSFVWADASTTDSLESFANNSFRIRASGGVVLYTNPTTTTGVYLNAGGSSWNVLSDRNRKESFLDVEGEDVLARLREVPVSTWRYVSEEDRAVRHIGPMAQDWHAAFGLGTDDESINMSDFDGVNLAAIQALEARTTEQAERIRSLEAEVAELRALVESLATRETQAAQP